MFKFALILTLALTGCLKDETISGRTAPSDVWVLSLIGEATVTERITIRFPEQGRVTGEAPCNSYFAEQSAPLPWIDLGPIGATRRACPTLELETRYFGLLERMALVETLGDTLLMTADDGMTLTYRLEAP